MLIERCVLVVLDSVGIGEAPDAAAFGDVGAHTLGNIARVCGGLRLPHLESLGLGNVALVQGLTPTRQPAAGYGKMAEVSAGKDTTTGHWELMGLHLEIPFRVYPEGFPPEVMERFEAAIGRGTLGNCPASGTEIIAELGAEHVATGKPIVYTSADSVFQIAAHEKVIPLGELYRMCGIARAQLRSEHEVSRIIARPFLGEVGAFRRTANRRDYSVKPPAPTLLDAFVAAGLSVHAVGKIEDIFDGVGITSAVHTKDNAAGVVATLRALRERPERGLIFTNLVDFDALYGHRNDPAGYAAALEAFDARVPELLAALGPRDLLVITADHGNDPTMPGTDHTREYVPLLVVGEALREGVNLGVRASFSDVAATFAEAMGVAAPNLRGLSFWPQIAAPASSVSGPNS